MRFKNVLIVSGLLRSREFMPNAAHAGDVGCRNIEVGGPTYNEPQLVHRQVTLAVEAHSTLQ